MTHTSNACRALAINCNAKVNDKEGNEAKDWRKGKPVRVLRKGHGDEKTLNKESNKGKKGKGKHSSSYAPDIGVRYVPLQLTVILTLTQFDQNEGMTGFTRSSSTGPRKVNQDS